MPQRLAVLSEPSENFRQSAKIADKAGDWSKAAALYKRTLDSGSKSFWDSYYYARAVLYSGDFEAAGRLISDLPAVDADEAAVATLTAELHERLGHYSIADEHWKRALDLGASPYWSTFGRARALSNLGKLDDARNFMEEALALPERENAGVKLFEWLKDATGRAPGALTKLIADRNPTLTSLPIDDLLCELLYRFHSTERISMGEQRIAVAQELLERLSDAVEVHENRFSIKNLRDLFRTFYTIENGPKIQNSSILDLGSGSHNPLGLLFICVLLGSRKAIAVDLERMQNPARAFRAMGRSADVLLTDATQVIGNHPISRTEIEKNIAGIDVHSLREGNGDSLDPTRLKLLHESAAALSIESSSIDILTSNSFLEHVDDLEPVLKEMARVTVPGGFGIHNIDGLDHWSYGNPDRHPLQFLREQTPGMICGSNRIRLLEFPALFERYGFKIQQIIPGRIIPIDDRTQKSFALPWRNLPRRYLEVATGVVVVRRI